jgi:hypothetical protein
MTEALRSGVYEHYKGKKYLVLGVARHTETGELMAVYVPLYELADNEGVQMAVRPLKMFREQVEVGSLTRPRFRFTGEDEGHGGEEQTAPVEPVGST